MSVAVVGNKLVGHVTWSKGAWRFLPNKDLLLVTIPGAKRSLKDLAGEIEKALETKVQVDGLRYRAAPKEPKPRKVPKLTQEGQETIGWPSSASNQRNSSHEPPQ